MTEAARRAATELLRRRAREELLAFMAWTWQGAGPFLVGRHTRAICARLTRAVADWERGVSTQLVLSVPFRHGKSEIAKAFQAFFLGRCAAAQPSVLEACYNAELAVDFSKAVRDLVRSEAYQALFPGVLPRPGSNRANLWQLQGSQSKVRATGLINGSSTGFGANLIVVDDYLRGHAESRSKTLKRAIQNAFQSDVYTRQNAPAAIVLVIATQWATDDLIGAIEAESGPGQRFAGFEFLRFPARKAGAYETLFPELYPADWYARQRAALGPRMAAALLDCAPRPEEGGRFDVSKVRLHTDLTAWPKTREVRAWDLASSAKERDGTDPDWTWGVRAALDIWYSSDDSVRQALTYELANQLAEVGIEVTPHGGSWDEVYSHQYESPIMWGWGSNSPIEVYALNYSTGWGNYAGYESAAIDGHLDDALAEPVVEDSYGHWQLAAWDGEDGFAPEGAATWAWIANVDHLYFKRSGLDVADQKPHPHGHGWSLVNNVDRWSWAK